MADVIFGKNGYLFLAGDNNAVVDQHIGKRSITKKQLQKWECTAKSRYDFFSSINIPFVMQIVPDKHAAYSEYLPFETLPTKKKNVTKVIDLIEGVVPSLAYYPLQVIEENKAKGLLFHRLDTHWTDKGAYVVYRDFMNRIEEYFKDASLNIIDNPKFEVKWFGGDLGAMLDLKMSSQAEIYLDEKASAKEIFNNRVQVTGKISIHENSVVDNDLTILIFGGSSTVNFIKFIKESFNKTIFCWSQNIDYDLVKDIKPNIVLNQTRERFLIRPADDFVGINTTEAAFIKGFDLTSPRKLWIDGRDIETILINSLTKISHPDNKAYVEGLANVSKLIGIFPLFNYAMGLNVNSDNLNANKTLIINKYRSICHEINESSEFDIEYVEQEIQTLGLSVLAKSSITNYLIYGRLFGYRSSKKFDGDVYLKTYPDVVSAGVCPLLHYIRYGKREGRKTL